MSTAPKLREEWKKKQQVLLEIWGRWVLKVHPLSLGRLEAAPQPEEGLTRPSQEQISLLFRFVLRAEVRQREGK